MFLSAPGISTSTVIALLATTVLCTCRTTMSQRLCAGGRAYGRERHCHAGGAGAGGEEDRVASEAGRIPVHNFEVEDTHSYFVGKANGGVWVHNQQPCWPRFADQPRLMRHFADHGADFGATTPDLYEQQAGNFLTDADPNTLSRVRANGDIVRYNPLTDEFGVLSSNNVVRTYYRPNPAFHGYPTNLDYFLYGH